MEKLEDTKRVMRNVIRGKTDSTMEKGKQRTKGQTTI